MLNRLLAIAFVIVCSAAIAAETSFPEHDVQCDEDLVVEQVLSDPLIAQPMEVKFDERNRLWVVEYRQYPSPAGIHQVDRDEYWRVQYDRMAPPPPHTEGSPFRGKDRISIHTDTTGDGHYDEHKVFVDGLNITTSIAFDRDGVWVVTPPYLVFYPDADQDDVPDSAPVVHLEGFGIEDTHSIANSLTWGPDGWLYGGNGSTSTMSVSSPFWGDDREPVARKGQNIWRYHPVTHAFEVYAEGGGNTFGLEIDAAGHVYSGHNGGNTRGFHFVKGGYYRKSFGKHGDLSNPNAFGFFAHMTHHTVERFSHHFVIYDAAELPERFHNQLVGIDVLHRDLVLSDFQADGSTFVTKDLSRPVTSDGEEFSPVDLEIGPDGCLYIADWADSAVSHLMNREGLLEPDTGRVFRVRRQGSERPVMPTFDNDELVSRLQSPNRQIRRTALRLLRERAGNEEKPATLDLDKVAMAMREVCQSGSRYALDAFWALHAIDRLTRDDLITAIGSSNPDLRRWAIRFGDESMLSPAEMTGKLSELAANEADAGVLVEIEAAIRDWPFDAAAPVINQLARRSEFASDTFYPLMLWWAVEATRPDDANDLITRIVASDVRGQSLYNEVIEPRLVQALASEQQDSDWAAIATLLQASPELSQRRGIYSGLEQALVGKAAPQIGESLKAELAKHADELSLDLRLRLGIDGAAEALLEQLASASTSVQKRNLAVVAETRPAGLAEPLLALAVQDGTSASLRGQLIPTLAAYDLPIIGQTLLDHFASFDKSGQAAVIELLASRPAWSTQLMDAIDAKQIDQKLVTPLLANRIQMQADKAVVARAAKMWPSIGVDKQDIAAEMYRYTRRVSVGHRGVADRGADLFKEHCAICHKLYDVGKQVGPDLTSYQRSNRELMLLALIAPSAEIREGFETAIVILDDGSVLTGILTKENESIIELKDAKANVRTIERDRVDTLQISPTSLMPTGMLEKFSDQNLRDLFAYLQANR